MPKSYFNDAIIGNSSMLGCLTGAGELIRLFWPNIDYPQHIDRMHEGIFLSGEHDTLWFQTESFKHSQRYIPDTNILETECINQQAGTRIVQTDFVLPDKDVLVRHFIVENIADREINLGFMHYSACISTTSDLSSILFDSDNDILIHYRHGYYLSVSADLKSFQFQLGNNAWEAASNTALAGKDNIGMMQDGALSWRLGRLQPGGKAELTLKVCASDTLKGVRELSRNLKNTDTKSLFDETRDYWTAFLKGAWQVVTGVEKLDTLYKRSLLIFKLMSDGKTGGLLAAPEVDEAFTRCGRYAYCWGRDAAFITGALDKCGLGGLAESFYHWAVKSQDEDGSWQQRYYMDGNLAPSWGLQVDETGALIWGMLEHYEVTKDIGFLENMRESVEKAMEFMCGFIDAETGLPGPSFDLWEERCGRHAYSSAAVYGGMKAGIEMGRLLSMEGERIRAWESASEGIREAIAKHFWKEEKGCFRRNLEDDVVDVSLLGLYVPFAAFDADDYRIRGTVEVIERTLTAHSAGGIKRYENDSYIGGNPWIVATLWVALYHIRTGDYAKAKVSLEWAADHSTGLGLLPEQVDREDGRPAWVIPLTWSHAMFVLTLLELSEAGVFQRSTILQDG